MQRRWNNGVLAVMLGTLSALAGYLCFSRWGDVLMPAQGATGTTNPMSNPASTGQGNAEEFHTWLRQSLKTLSASTTREEFLEAEQTLANRLRCERITLDSSVNLLVGRWVDYGDLHAKANPREDRYKEATRCIDALLPLIESQSDRKLLVASLCLSQAEYLTSEGRVEESGKSYQKAMTVLGPLAAEVEVKRVTALVGLGHSLQRLGKTSDAEAPYLDAMSSQWYLLAEFKDREFLRNKYVEAVRALIECRRGNAKALKEIALVPAAGPEIAEELKQAIKAAVSP